MDNFIEYRLSKVQARMKADVVPHIYVYQKDRQLVSSQPRLLSEKMTRKTQVVSYLTEDEASVFLVLPEEAEADVVPHMFACQKDRQLVSSQPRVLSEKRARKKQVASYLTVEEASVLSVLPKKEPEKSEPEPSTSTSMHYIMQF